MHIFHCMTFFLAAIVAFLFILVFWTLNASFCPIIAKRGEFALSGLACSISILHASDEEVNTTGAFWVLTAVQAG
jgi:hypothetical protein